MADGSARRAPPDSGKHGSIRRVIRFLIVSDAEFVASVRGLSRAWTGRAWGFGGPTRESDLAVVHGASRTGARDCDVRDGDWRRHLAMGDAGAAGSVRLAQRLCDLGRSGPVWRRSVAVAVAQRAFGACRIVRKGQTGRL